jgi:catechol 2,3-dioxygenase-like lactoylglutathione lyase family enzyme
MTYSLGRLIDHLDIRVRDFEASRRFYRAVFGALGLGDAIQEAPDYLWLDELYVTAQAEGGRASTNLHLCFQAQDRQAVASFHAAGLAAGGRDNGAPGVRDYHAGYYAAFLLDPDGNNIEAKVDERVATRSAASVKVTTRDS